MLQTTIYGNTVQTYIFAAATLLGVFVAVSLFRKVVGRRIKSAVQEGRLRVESALVDDFEGSMRSLAYVVALSVAVEPLSFGAGPDRIVSAVLLTAIAFLVISTAYNGLRLMLDASLRRRGMTLEEHKSRALLPIVKVVAWLVAGTFLLDNFGFKITTILAGLGVAGVAVGFAAQAVLGDLFSYFAILFDRPFRIGDFIVLDTLRGNIEYIGLKTTRIRSLDGEQIVLANSDLTSSRVHNYRRMRRRRVLFGFGVTYQTPADKLDAIPDMVREIIGAVDKATLDRVHFKLFGQSSLDFEVVYYVEDPDYNVYMDVQQAINLGLVRSFEGQGIDFAYPTRTLHIAGGAAEEPADA